MIKHYEDLQRAASLLLKAADLDHRGQQANSQLLTGRAQELVRRYCASLDLPLKQHHLLSAAASAPQTSDSRLARVLAYIESNLSEPIRNADMAAILGVSETHFFRCFRRQFGIAPHAYVRIRRAELAKSLMLTTSLPLIEIALQCGLADQSHFTRLFRQLVGESPAKWRSLRAGIPTSPRRSIAPSYSDLNV